MSSLNATLRFELGSAWVIVVHILSYFYLWRSAYQQSEGADSKRWMSTEDGGAHYVSFRYRLKYITSCASLVTRHVKDILGVISNALTPDELYKGLFEDVLLVLLYLLSDDVLHNTEKLRLSAVLSFRIFHGRRLASDFTSGLSSSSLSLQFRVSYASGHWQQEIINAFCVLNASKETLMDAAVLESQGGELHVNSEMHLQFERTVRCFAAQRARSCSLYLGGPYAFGLLFSSDPDQRNGYLEYAQKLFANLLRYEERLVDPLCPSAHTAFDSSYIWRHNVFFREVLAHIALNTAATRELLWLLRLVFQSHYHTKGIEDVFRWLLLLLRMIFGHALT